MVKFVAPIFLVACVVGFSAPAQAVPLSSCAVSGTDSIGNDLLTCNAFEDDADANAGSFALNDPFPTPDWYTPSYAILYADIAHTIATDVVSFTSSGGTDTLTLYTDSFANFANIVATALGGTHISLTQAATTTFNVNFQASLNPVGAFNCGNNPSATCDTINVVANGSTPPPPPPSDVPEPATLTLLGVGGAVAALRRRKATV